ncbi:hypothetical protein HUU05_05325 [candidate division KSB1 bacterium]|nr:hypothetical protein [candidate division KSB1 bacterium]
MLKLVQNCLLSGTHEVEEEIIAQPANERRELIYLSIVTMKKRHEGKFMPFVFWWKLMLVGCHFERSKK